MRNTVEVQLKPGSFGEWFDARSRGEVASLEDLPYLSDLYPGRENQEHICYLARTYGDGFDPYDAEACKGELRMRRELDAWMSFDDVEDAYWELWRQKTTLYETYYGADPYDYRTEVVEDNPEAYYEWKPWSREQELSQRIEDSLPPHSGRKPFSKKCWGTNRKARYVRRDGSPRGHWHDGISHEDVLRLERAARTSMKRLLRDIRDGVVDPDAVHLTAQSNALDEERRSRTRWTKS